LNIEQRKLLTIGVELAAKPALLLFLDEPTSGLDSQSSWSIITLLRKLADSGQAVLATIHQPSAMLFQQFDRLLFLYKGGKTVYFGDLGHNSRTLLDYFENSGARKCSDDENPAEYMLEAIGAGPGKEATADWPAIWNASAEAKAVQAELDRLHKQDAPKSSTETAISGQYAMPLSSQFFYVNKRVFQQFWRTPQYVFGKMGLCTASALFVGFSFWQPDASQAGLQNTIFAVFMVLTIFTPLVQQVSPSPNPPILTNPTVQIMPRFVTQRSLYEVRERPSKTYSWIPFMLTNMLVEMPYQIAAAILVFVGWYFSVFGAHNSLSTTFTILAFALVFYTYTSSFAYMIIAALPDAATAGPIAALLFSLMLTFSGVLQKPDSLPSFWIFMWRVSPFTYMVGGWAGAGITGRAIVCAANELAVFNPPSNSTCGVYLQPYFQGGAPGQLLNPSATSNCQYCPLSSADQFLAASDIYAGDIYRNLGISYAYVVFNTVAAVLLYYLFRVRRVSIFGAVKGKVGEIKARKAKA
jgi:ATP-binding cassette, subfamily G (WHITE), member 2, PDR